MKASCYMIATHSATICGGDCLFILSFLCSIHFLISDIDRDN